LSILCSSIRSLCLRFFFFFQAEDGIRDFHVTGVQTCALPICFTVQLPGREAPGLDLLAFEDAASGEALRVLDAVRHSRKLPRGRSEERRVGEECRSRWTT